MTKEEFIKQVTDGLVAPPQYFPKNAVMNKMGYDSIDDVLNRGLTELSVDEFKRLADADESLILDTRLNTEFTKGFIPGSLFVGIDDNFAPWVGALITDLKTPLLIVAEEGREEEVVTRLARVGYDNAVGFLKGGFEAWKASGNAIDSIVDVTATDIAKNYAPGELNILDVRKESEYNSEHIQGVENFPLDFINQNIDELDKSKKYYLHCAGGYRSVIAGSIFKQHGIKDVVNIEGGFNALKDTTLPKTEYVEPTTML
jgi:rhodanese-related sulfurtransferase